MSNCVGKKKEILASAARTVTTTGVAFSLPEGATDVGILMNTSADASAGTFTAKLQTSSDGSVWTDVAGATTSAVTAVGQDFGFATAHCLSLVRCVLTAASTPSATQKVFVIFNSVN
jgi:hypothetical protein